MEVAAKAQNNKNESKMFTSNETIICHTLRPQQRRPHLELQQKYKIFNNKEFRKQWPTSAHLGLVRVDAVKWEMLNAKSRSHNETIATKIL